MYSCWFVQQMAVFTHRAHWTCSYWKSHRGSWRAATVWQMQTLTPKLLSAYQNTFFFWSPICCVVVCNTCCLDCYISRHLMSEQSHLLCLTVLMCLCVVCLLLQGFVSKLDEFICWLRDALETTDNWTPPRADIDSLKLYLETHLVSYLVHSFSFYWIFIL